MKKILALMLINIFAVSLAGLAIAGGDDNGHDGYTLSLKELIKQARGSIDRVDVELENQKKTKENEKRETVARLYFEKGNTLYKQGKLKEARKQWQEALDLTSHPDMKDYIRQNDRKARDQMKIQKVKRADSGAETTRGYDLMTAPKAETKQTKKTTPRIRTQKQPKVKKIPAAKKSKRAKTPKTEVTEVQKGYVFEGSSLIVNDVKETQVKQKRAVKQKNKEKKSKDKAVKKSWQQRAKTAEPKKQTEKGQAIEQGYTFEGSYLLINDVKETKKPKVKKTDVKKAHPKAKSVSPAPKIVKPKVQKTETRPPQRGYDIFVK